MGRTREADVLSPASVEVHIERKTCTATSRLYGMVLQHKESLYIRNIFLKVDLKISCI
jgi:hypothetical protein